MLFYTANPGVWQLHQMPAQMTAMGFVRNVKCLTGLFAILKGRDFSPAPCIKISLRVFSTMTRPPCQLEIADARFLELTRK
jgi:hypothetical protein